MFKVKVIINDILPGARREPWRQPWEIYLENLGIYTRIVDYDEKNDATKGVIICKTISAEK